jgi:hypothetical protein
MVKTELMLLVVAVEVVIRLVVLVMEETEQLLC